MHTLSSTKDAADVTIAMELALLDHLLPNKQTKFVIVTKDWFGVEVMERVALGGRGCAVVQNYDELVKQIADDFVDI